MDAFEEVGPVLAIGRPGEVVAPLGAAREYVDHTAWQERVLEHAEQCQLVIMLVDATAGMQWEVDNVPKKAGYERVLILFPPETYRTAGWYQGWKSLRRSFRFLPAVDRKAGAVLFDNHDDAFVVIIDDASERRAIRTIKNAWWASGGKANLRLRNNIAAQLIEAGDHANARIFLEETLAIQSEVLDDADIDLLATQSNLGTTLTALGECDQARELLRASLEGQRQKLGKAHNDTLTTQQNLAAVLNLMGESSDALPLLEATAAARARLQGDEDADTLKAKNNLATTLVSMERYAEARDLYLEVLERRQSLLGDEDIHTPSQLRTALRTLSADSANTRRQ